jgi:hypothetical protein
VGRALSAFAPIKGLKDVYAATRDELRCTAIRLRSGGLCLFSPVKGLSAAALESLAALGAVEALLAPNHWHNMGLHEYVKAFPDARLYASSAASGRLEVVTQLRFRDAARLQEQLPDRMTLVAPGGLKTGEVWLSVARPKHRAWIVVDAFCGAKATKPGGFGEPDLLKTFPKFGLGDRAAYLPWLERQIAADRPTMIVPCHGAISADPGLIDRIRRLIAAKL